MEIQSLLEKGLKPYSDNFEEAFRSYFEQIEEAVRKNKHHDHRRNLFINFLRQGLNLDPTEFELEKKIKVLTVRGRIDALFQQLIIEVKTNLERERQDAEIELKKYFESQTHPYDYFALVTDGLRFEIYIYENQAAHQIRAFTFEKDSPLAAFRHLDQLFFTGKLLVPTSEDIVERFGIHSATYNSLRRSLFDIFEEVKNETSVIVKFKEWNALLAKVYGSEIGDKMLFITHTYLAMLSRAIVTMALFPKTRRTAKAYRGIMNGDFFKQNRLANLAEPDFFSWALSTPSEQRFLEDLRRLFTCLDIYNYEKIDGDILKELYQGLVDPQSRHDLGEYYTPDWLAELVLEKINYTGGRLLDPSCGSGSFLYAGARRLRKISKLSKGKLVKEVTQNIIGIDIHPVAVLMTKANLLLSLKEELSDYQEEINLQVYMADTLMTGEDRNKNSLVIPVSEDQEEFRIPFESIDRSAGAIDVLIDRLCDFVQRGVESVEKEDLAYKGFQASLHKDGYSNNETFFWQHNFRLLLKLEREKRNSVWAYILKNAYRPSYLRQDKVDYIVGNPPWLAYAFIQNKAYKERVKKLTFDHNLLKKTDRNLFTRMDTSTLFFAHCQRDFLKPNGEIAFVMPKSVMIPAKQHLRFQQMGFTEIIDLSDVIPLFNVRSCVLIRGKDPKTENILSTVYHGTFHTERNLPLTKVEKLLTKEQSKHSFMQMGMEPSPYYSKFFQGATLVPRCLWFVEPGDPTNINPEKPFLRTSREAHLTAKKPWTMEVEGQIEKDFLFGTLLARELLPFVVHGLSLVVLPISISSGNIINIIDHEDALSKGFVLAHDWFQSAQGIWNSFRKNKNTTHLSRLNYDRLLTSQPFKKSFLVLYNQSGTNLSAALITPQDAKKIGHLKIKGFIVDSKCYWFGTDSEEEAHYLIGILNSEIVNEAIKPYQTQGLQGERDIHRRPFEVCNIPLFDPKNLLHQRIVNLSRECRKKLSPLVSKMDAPVSKMRSEARRIVADLLDKLNKEVALLLKINSHNRRPKRKSDSKQGKLFG